MLRAVGLQSRGGVSLQCYTRAVTRDLFFGGIIHMATSLDEKNLGEVNPNFAQSFRALLSDYYMFLYSAEI
jgi:hypothetical protein